MSNIPLSDQEARNTIISIFDKNFLVESGAGSGKTTYLVRRMIETVKTGKCRVDEIAAITFTKKAASELRERFQTKLEKEYEGATDENERKVLEEALQNIDQSFIGTVHSFCGRLLRERPVEAGIDPEFKELDNMDEALLEQQAWEEYLLKLKLENSALLSNLETIGVSPLDLYSSFKKMNNYSDVNLVSEKTNRPNIENALAEVFKFVERAKDSIPDVPLTDKGYDDLQKAIKQVIRLKRNLNLDRDINIIKIISIFDKKLDVTLNRWTSKNEAKDYKEEVNILKQDTNEPVMKAWREYCHFYILEFLKPAIKYYEEVRSKLSYLNFQDLLIKTATLLKNNSVVRQYFQNKYNCLLVDEFQDTDPIQAEIVFYLTGSNINEKDWQKLTPKPGTLFVVGDPKQSIYRFRRADIDIYNLVKKLIKDSGGEVLKLTSNFRSLNSVGNYLNPIFKDILPQQNDRYQAEFASMDTVNEDELNTISGVKSLLISSEHTKKEAIVNCDADSIAKIIRDAVDGNMMLSRTKEELDQGMNTKATYKDFLILLRYKDSMDVYARTLEAYGIPVKISGGSAVDQSMEIKELLKLLKLLSNVDNQVLLVAVLRGLFFGISDNTLYKFRCAGGNFNIFIDMPDSLQEKHKSELNNAFTKIKEYYLWTRKYNPAIVIEKIILDLGLIPYVAREEMYKSKYGNIYYILERLKKLESEGVTEYSNMVKQFETILNTSIEEELDIFCEEDTVRIMNLHKAKGLEAPVVFLAHPFKKTEFPATSHVERINNVSNGYFVFSKPTGEFSSICIGEPKNWDEYREAEENFLKAEEKRLVYVAATRAKNLLIISSCHKTDKNPWALLLENLKEADEIQINDIQKALGLISNIKDISLDDYNNMKLACENWKKDLSSKEYVTAAPTDYKDSYKLWDVTRSEGGGLAWGNAVHRTLEYLVKGNRYIDLIVEQALIENDLDLDKKTELMSLVEKFKQSSIWSRIQKAESKFTELSFSVKFDKQHAIFNEIKQDGDTPVILTGTIDLAFKENGEWVVVDYKTDRVNTEEDYKKLEEVYKTQTRIYRHVLEELLGEKVKSEEIVFLERDIS